MEEFYINKINSEEIEVTQSTTTKYIFDNKGGLIATIVGDGESTSTYYIHTDHLGGTNVVTDENGEIVEVSDYLPYGDSRINGGNHDVQRKFIGQMYDQESNLNYLNHRYYDSTRGQFLNQDPIFWSTNIPAEILIDPQQQNSYSYARNNPINRSDPTGQLSKKTLNNLTGRLGKIINGFRNYLTNKIFSNNSNSVAPTIKTHIPVQRTTTWDQISDARIGELDPRVRQPAVNFINNAESQLGIQLRVVDSHRSIEEQNKLYEQGRIRSGGIITFAKGGESFHNYGRALDVVIIKEGRSVWNPITDEIARIGEAEGFEWGGRWTDWKDYSHFEMPLGQTTDELFKTYYSN